MHRGVVAAGDPQTARAGATALRAGGNAIDAVCAAAFASFVVELPLTSPAGAGVLLWGDAGGLHIEDFFARVPGLGAAHLEPVDFHDVVVDFGPTTQAFHVGRASAAVPGALQGLLEVHARAGRMPLPDLLAPAIALARDGFEVSAPIAGVLELLAPIVALDPELVDLCSADGRIARGGDRLDNPRLAAFLEEVGRIGPAIVRGAYREALLARFGPERGGLLTAADLDAYEPVHREPLRVDLGDASVFTHPPPSSGGGLIALGLRLALRSGYGADPFLGPAHALRTADLLRRVSAARRAGYDDRVHDRKAVEAMLADDAVDALLEEPSLGSTTHISVLDGAGGAASLTTTNGEGCGYLVGDLGFQMNNFLGEEDINPGGFHTAPAGSALTTMMAPTAILRGGSAVVLGSGGSNRIRSAILQTVLHVLVSGRTLRQAVDAPRQHVEGSKLWFEATGMGGGAPRALLDAWPDATRFDDRSMFFGGVHAVGPDGGVGDARRGGAVARATDL